MAKITYASLKLKPIEEVKKVEINGSNIEVYQYLPMSDKMDIVDVTLQKSKVGRIYNPLKIEMYFHLYLVYLYTNISFTEKQKEDEEKLYDTLESNGIINKIVEAIPDNEYNQLLEFLEESMDINLDYSTTAAGIIDELLEELPQSAQTAADILNNVNMKPMQNVIDFAKAINNGKDA